MLTRVAGLLTATTCFLVSSSIVDAQTVAGGYSHALIVTTDGSVWAWGANSNGQLGIGNTTQQLTPVQVTSLTNVIAVAAGDYHSLALKSDGTVWAWGYNGSGQLGDGTNTQRNSPAMVTGPSNVIAIAAGSSHSVALGSDGTIWTWGGNANGQLGNGSTTSSRQASPLSLGWTATAVAAGASHTLAVRNDGTVWTWGANGSGQLGDNSTTQRISPVQASGVTNAVAVAGGFCHSLVLRSDGTVVGSGCNNFGQMGDGTQTPRLTMAQGPPLTGVSKIGANYQFSAALTQSGDLWTWGYNGAGQLGDGTTATRLSPTRVTALANLIAFAAARDGMLAVTSTKVVYTWGTNGSGQLGDGTTTGHYTPAAISDTDYRWKVAGPRFSVAPGTYTTDQTVVVTDATQGAQIHYTLDGADPTLNDPVLVSGSSILVDHTLTLKARAWKDTMPPSDVTAATYTLTVALPSVSPNTGTYTSAQTVTMSTTTTNAVLRYTLDGSTPVETSIAYTEAFVVSTTTTVKVIGFRAGWNSSALVSKTYTMNFGTLSPPTIEPAAGTYTSSVTVTLSAAPGATIRYTTNGTNVTTSSPVYSGPFDVTATSTLNAVAYHPDYGTSTQSSAAYTILVATPLLSPPGGTYPAGQTISITSPTTGATARYTLDGRDPSTSDAVVPSTGIVVGNFTLKVRAWKSGCTTSAVASATYQATGSLSARRIVTGPAHTLALRGDGVAWSWGANSDGQLGDGSTTGRKYPGQVAALSGVVNMAVGGRHTAALRSDGVLFTWGWGYYGQLGDGSGTSANWPRELLAPTNVSAIAAGQYYTLAVGAGGAVWAWGSNGDGQLGDGSNTQRNTPVAVSGLSNVTAVYAAGSSSFARKADGTLWSWGANGSGQLATGNTTGRWTPGQITGLSGVASAATGGTHVLAILSDGTVRAWGANGSGQLGDGTTTQRNTPVVVSRLTNVIAVAAGNIHSVALTSDGGVWTWGNDMYGQLGDGGGNNRLAPARVAGLPPIAVITAAAYHTLAIAEDGSVWAWGYNADGQLGDGTNIIQKTPVQIAEAGMEWRVATPMLSVTSGLYTTEQNVVVTNSDPAAVMHYTTTGLDPIETDPVIASGSTVPVTVSLSLKVRAWKAGSNAPSTIAVGSYELRASTPTFSPTGGQFSAPQTVTLTTTTAQSVIRYTIDGSTPTAGSPQYTGPVTVATTTMLKAAAFRTGWTSSLPGSATYTMNFGTLAPPTIAPTGGTYSNSVTVMLTSIAGATIRYTTNGWDPGSYSPLYTAPLTVATSQTIKAIAFHPDYTTSPIASSSYTIQVATPLLSPSTGTYPAGQTITVSDDTSGATIRYTLDGRDPVDTDPTIATGSTVIVGNYTLKARAWKTGCTTSAIAAATYQVTGSFTTPHLDGGNDRSIAVRSDGIAWSWGSQSGNGSYAGSLLPQQLVPFTGVKQASAGGSHVVFVLSDGSVAGWGWNDYGQVGDGTNTLRLRPVAIPSFTGVTTVSAGDRHTVALKSDGTVWTWGLNASGQLGDGTTSNRNSPAPVPGLTGITAVSAGNDFVVALSSTGRVYTWGNNQNGQLGDGTTTQHRTPVLLALTNIVAIFAGERHVFAHASDGTWWAWGDNQLGQLGDGTNTPRLSPVQIAFPQTMTTVAPGGGHTIGLASDGTVWAWGANYYGQLGDSSGDRNFPAQVPGLTNIAAIGAGTSHSFALAADGTVWAWGDNGSGAAGDGTTTDAHTPTMIAGPGMGWKVWPPTISPAPGVYYANVTALVSSSDPTATLHYTLNGSVPSELDPVVAAGGSIVVTASATLQVNAWKSGSPPSEPAVAAYELKASAPSITPTTGHYPGAVTVTISNPNAGSTVRYTVDGTEPTLTSTEYTAPIGVTGTATVKAMAFKSGWTSSETAYASYWITAGTVARPAISPAAGAYSSPQMIAIQCATEGASIRYTLDGSEPGQTSPVYQYPFVIAASTTVKARAFRSDFTPSDVASATYALDAAGAAATPTLSSAGGRFATRQFVTVQAAQGATVRYTLDGRDPVETDTAVGSDHVIVVDRSAVLKVRAWETGATAGAVRRANFLITGAVAAGEYHTLALAADGTVWAWGRNYSGSLGDGTDQYRLSPVAALISDVVAISAGPEHSLALKRDGTVWAWGDNWCGELGDGTNQNRWTPVQVPGLSGVIAIAAGGAHPFYVLGHSLALKSDGTVWAWGCNAEGQLGDGTTTARSSPVRVAGLEGVIAISAGGTSSLAVQGDGAARGAVWAWGGDSSDPHVFPHRLPDVTDAADVAGGLSDGLALRRNGTLWEWGRWTLNGDVVSPNPTPVPVVADVFAIASGAGMSHALSKTGVRWAWGDNYSHELGHMLWYECTGVECLLGGQLRSSNPTFAAAAGYQYSAWVLADGTVSASGRNNWGQLGDGTINDSTGAIVVPGVTLANNGWLFTDEDDDGLPAWRELLAGTDPYAADTNGNGLFDGAEEDSGASALNPDTDLDGIANWIEIATGTDPYTADTDGDGVADGADAYPLDPTRSALPPPTPGDVTPPTITLTEPLTARPIGPGEL